MIFLPSTLFSTPQKKPSISKGIFKSSFLSKNFWEVGKIIFLICNIKDVIKIRFIVVNVSKINRVDLCLIIGYIFFISKNPLFLKTIDI